MAQITADEFEARCAERCGMSIAELRASGRLVRPCDCDYEGCEGWQSVSRELALEEAGVIRRPTTGEVMAATATAIRAATEFETSMRQVHAMAGSTPAQVAALTAQAEGRA